MWYIYIYNIYRKYRCYFNILTCVGVRTLTVMIRSVINGLWCYFRHVKICYSKSFCKPPLQVVFDEIFMARLLQIWSNQHCHKDMQILIQLLAIMQNLSHSHLKYMRNCMYFFNELLYMQKGKNSLKNNPIKQL